MLAGSRLPSRPRSGLERRSGCNLSESLSRATCSVVKLSMPILAGFHMRGLELGWTGYL